MTIGPAVAYGLIHFEGDENCKARFNFDLPPGPSRHDHHCPDQRVLIKPFIIKPITVNFPSFFSQTTQNIPYQIDHAM